MWLLQDRVNYEHSPNLKSQLGPSGSISTWSSSFLLRIKKRRRNKNHLLSRFINTLEIWDDGAKCIYLGNIWETYLQSQLWSKSYGQYSNKLSDLGGSQDLRILPFTLLNESHWFRVYKNFYLTGLELFVFLFLKASFKKQYGCCKQDFNYCSHISYIFYSPPSLPPFMSGIICSELTLSIYVLPTSSQQFC